MGAITTRLTLSKGRLAREITRHLSERRESLVALAGRLENLSPLGVLGRGYAVCWNGDRTGIVSDASLVEKGDAVHVTLHRGELGCKVITMKRPSTSTEIRTSKE